MSDANDSMQDFNPNRLRLARERRSLTKEALADLCGVSRRSVTDWESGRVENPPIGAICQALKYPPSFFSGEDIEEVPVEAVSFRALTSMTQKQVHRALANASMISAFSGWIDRHYYTPASDVPSFEEFTASWEESEPSPVDAANSIRAIWGLGAKPIRDMLALVEGHGVRVFGLTADDREVDAFSYWQGDRALIFLNSSKSAERLRFDLAHELGHLCMHRGIATNRKRQFELDANAFASTFLIPKSGLLPQVVSRLTLSDVMTLKQYWRVSATAMVRRLKQLGRITDWQYRTWMIDLSKRGFRTCEPDGMAKEQSTLLRQVMALAREDGWSINRLSAELGIPAADLSSALLGLTVTPLAGTPIASTSPAPTSPPEPVRLQAVRNC